MRSADNASTPVPGSLQDASRHVELLESIKPGSPEHEILRAQNEVQRETARVVNVHHMWRYAAYVATGGLLGAFCSYVLGWTPNVTDISSRSLHLVGVIMKGGGNAFSAAGDFVDAAGKYLPEVAVGAIGFLMLAIAYKILKSLNFIAPAIILAASWVLLGPVLGASAAMAIGVGGVAGHYAHVVHRDAASTRRVMRNARIVAKSVFRPLEARREARLRKSLRERHARVRSDLGLR
jgi:hypothetical protein